MVPRSDIKRQTCIERPHRTSDGCRHLGWVTVRPHGQICLRRWRLQDRKKHRRLWIFGDAIIFSVFHYAHHLSARTIRLLEVTARGTGYGAKDLARKFLVDDGHGRRVFVVMPRKGPAREQRGARGLEVFWRYAEREGVSNGIRWPEIGGRIGKNVRAPFTTADQRCPVD